DRSGDGRSVGCRCRERFSDRRLHLRGPGGSDMGNQGQQGKPDRQGNIGRPDSDRNNPTGTSGRESGTGSEKGQPDKEGSRPDQSQPDSDDEDEGIGTSNTNR